MSDTREIAHEIVKHMAKAGAAVDEKDVAVYFSLMKKLTPPMGWQEANKRLASDVYEAALRLLNLLDWKRRGDCLDPKWFLLRMKDWNQDEAVHDERFANLTSELKGIIVMALQITEEKPGLHGRSDFSKLNAAQCAMHLLEKHGLKASTSPTSTYREIAQLFYLALTGEEADLERACKEMRRLWSKEKAGT